MRDLNFFSEFIKEKRGKNKAVTGVMIIAVAFFGVVLGTSGYLRLQIASEKSRIEKDRKVLSSPSVVEKYEKLESGSSELRALKNMQSHVDHINEYMDRMSYLSSGNILRIFNSLPKSVEILSFNINEKDFSMDCKGKSRVAALSTVRLLKEVGMKDVSISTMVKSSEGGEDVQKFQITGKIGGGKYE